MQQIRIQPILLIALSTREPVDPAVVCDQCKTTWVRTQATNPKGHPAPFQYTWKKMQVCDDCDKAAKGHFATGALPTCKTCGGSLQVVEATKK